MAFGDANRTCYDAPYDDSIDIKNERTGGGNTDALNRLTACLPAQHVILVICSLSNYKDKCKAQVEHSIKGCQTK